MLLFPKQRSSPVQNAEKVSVTMTPEMMRVIRASVESGEYASTSEAMRDAVRIWQREREEFRQRFEGIRARVQRSVEDPRALVSRSDLERRLTTLHEDVVKGEGRETL